MSGNTNTRKRLVASFLQFLSSELEKEGIDSEMAESIDVARQCLRMAYTTTAEDVPASQTQLIDIFRKHCPPPVSKICYLLLTWLQEMCCKLSFRSL